MRLRGKGMTIAIATLGLGGALAGGVGIAQAASGPATTTSATTAAATTSPSTAPYGHGMGYGMGAGSGMGYGMGMGYGARGTGDWQDSPMAAAASYLGLSPTDLMTQMRSGKSLASIAQARGKTVSGLKSAMLAAVKSNIEANGKLSAEQKATLLAQASSRIDTMINRTCPVGTGSGTAGGAAGYGPMRGMMGAVQG